MSVPSEAESTSGRVGADDQPGAAHVRTRRGDGHHPAPHVGMLVEAAAGFGRVLQVEGTRALVEYFDRPGEGGLERRFEDARRLRRGVLAPQTRVHWRED